MQVGFARGGPRFHLTDGRRCDLPTRPSIRAEQRPAECDATPSPGVQGQTVSLELVGAAEAEPVGTVRAETSVSYFKGRPDEWLVGIPTFQQIAYPAAWPGIDVRYERAGHGLEASYVLAPGADPDLIRVAWHGVDSGRVSEDGALVLATSVGTVWEAPPSAWQDDVNGRRTSVPARFELLTDGSDGAPVEAGLRLGAYDPTRPLTIDPTISYSGYIGGNGTDQGNAIAVDSTGAAYVVGETGSDASSFPTLVGPDLSFNASSDAFVAKVKPDGSGLVCAGYIGGDNIDIANAVAVDSTGAAYVAGETRSPEATFPVRGGPDTSYNGGSRDAFVAKVNPDGSGLTYAGYIGGTLEERAFGIAVDGAGAAYITGSTNSNEASFPGVGLPDPTYNGGVTDAFVAKVKADGSGLNYLGYLGGNDEDVALGVAVDSTGAAYVTGYTGSTESTFPVSVGPDLTYNGGLRDAFVVKVNPNGSGLAYAGYIGGSAPLGDQAFAIAVDGSGADYIVGVTDSNESSFPVVGGPDLTFNDTENGTDAFIAKVNPGGSGIAYAGYIGGAGIDYAVGIAVDTAGTAYVAGRTTSDQSSFPVAVGPSLTHHGQTVDSTFDAFSVKVTDAGGGPPTPTPTVTPTTTATPPVTATPVPTATPPGTTCQPRPAVRVNVVPGAPGVLNVTIQAGQGAISRVQFGTPPAIRNALVSVAGGPANQTQAFNFTPAAGQTAVQVSVQSPDRSRDTFVPLTVTDACGPWQTFVGGGPGSF